MIPTRRERSLTRRRLVDRRARPTALGSALRWQGRRQACRRTGEGHEASVDSRTRRTVVLALCVCVGSLLDALGTLHHVRQGGQEANPLLALALTGGPWLFLPLKIGLTGMGVGVLVAHHQVLLAQRGLYGLTLSYGVVLLVHLALVLRLV